MFFIILILLLISSIIALQSVNPLFVGDCQFYIYLAIVIVNFLYVRKINLLQVWILGYLFVINSDVLLFFSQYKGTNYWAVQFLTLSNNLFILGYLIDYTFIKKRLPNYGQKINNLNQYRNKKRAIVFFLLIALFTSIFIYTNIENSILRWLYGRSITADQYGQVKFLTLITDNCHFILPAIIVYYFRIYLNKKSILLPLLVSLPIFAMIIMDGTRFVLLFAFGGFVIAGNLFNVNKISLKSACIAVASILVVVPLAEFMKVKRSVVADEMSGITELYTETDNAKILSQKIALYTSPEGVVKLMNYNHDYYQKHEFQYGMSNAFILYFWIPRSVWKDKPTMLPFWLFRKYEDPPTEGFSASVGFMGDFYADFGYFSLIVIFLFGFLINRLNCVCERCFSGNSFSRVLAAMCYPYMFFFVRDPITSSMVMVGMMVTFYIFKWVLFNKHNTLLN